jgi:hypothetical protein
MSSVGAWKSSTKYWEVKDSVVGNCEGVNRDDCVVYVGTEKKVKRVVGTSTSDWGSIDKDEADKVEGTIADTGKHFRITYKGGKLDGFVFTLSKRSNPGPLIDPKHDEIPSGSWTAQEGNRPIPLLPDKPDAPPASE